MAQTTTVKYIVLMQDQLTPGLKKQSAALSGVNSQLAKTNVQMKAAKTQSKGLSSSFGILKKAFVAFIAVAGVVKVLGSSLKAWDKQKNAIAQVNAGLIATGNISRKTLKQLEQEAENLQKNTLFGDEEILAGATAQLLTFTNIAGKEFSRTQKAVLDVATRLAATSGGVVDLKSVSIQLGKALNDPIQGLSALGRSGITFTSTQKDVIRAMWETGKQAEAQNMILAELEKQYGGSAEAAAKAGLGPFKQFKNVLGDINEMIGDKLAGPLNKASKGISKFFDTVSKHGHNITSALRPLHEAFMNIFKQLGNVFSALFKTRGAGDQTASTFEKIGKVIKIATLPLKFIMDVFGVFLKIVVKVIKWVRKMYKQFSLFRKIVDVILWPLKQVIKAFQWVSRQVTDNPLVQNAKNLKVAIEQYRAINELKKKGIKLNDKQIWFLKNYKEILKKLAGKQTAEVDPFGIGGPLGGGGGLVPDTTISNKTEITGAAPKIFNIRVGNLVEQIIIKTEQFKESKEEVRQTIIEALTEGLADFQINAG